jgi:HEAT repeats
MGQHLQAEAPRGIAMTIKETCVGALRGWSCLGLAVICTVQGLSLSMVAQAQQGKPAQDQAQDQSAAKPDAEEATPVAGDLSKETPEQRTKEAWRTLSDAMGDAKHPQVRIQALAALGLLRTARAEKMIAAAMADTDVDVRTAAVLAAGESKDRNLFPNLRKLLDDKEPQVVFTAATTLWKLGDKSGEDILMSVVDGERRAGPTLINGTRQTINRDLHDPAALAKIGALQGASMLLGPFGFGITAYEYIRKNGGDLSRVVAIEAIGQGKTEPIHKKLIGALGDKDPAVRAAATKALADYRDEATSKAIFALLADLKLPVRLTAAASYLRTTGVPGPPASTLLAERQR